MSLVIAQAKDGEALVRFKKTTDGITARVSFIDQYGVERVMFIPAAHSDYCIEAVRSVLYGETKIQGPDEGVKNVYDEDIKP